MFAFFLYVVIALYSSQKSTRHHSHRCRCNTCMVAWWTCEHRIYSLLGRSRGGDRRQRVSWWRWHRRDWTVQGLRWRWTLRGMDLSLHGTICLQYWILYIRRWAGSWAIRWRDSLCPLCRSIGVPGLGRFHRRWNRRALWEMGMMVDWEIRNTKNTILWTQDKREKTMLSFWKDFWELSFYFVYFVDGLAELGMKCFILCNLFR